METGSLGGRLGRAGGWDWDLGLMLGLRSRDGETDWLDKENEPAREMEGV